jgi:hypothetical protein
MFGLSKLYWKKWLSWRLSASGQLFELWKFVFSEPFDEALTRVFCSHCGFPLFGYTCLRVCEPFGSFSEPFGSLRLSSANAEFILWFTTG